MKLNDLLFGRPLRSSEEAGEKLGPVGGLSVFGLDALSSAAYGPEAALTLMIPLAAAGIAYIVPITASIIVLLAIVYFSYRQTIAAYPSGGGSYTVARENLGEFPGLLAAAALMIDDDHGEILDGGSRGKVGGAGPPALPPAATLGDSIAQVSRTRQNPCTVALPLRYAY